MYREQAASHFTIQGFLGRWSQDPGERTYPTAQQLTKRRRPPQVSGRRSCDASRSSHADDDPAPPSMSRRPGSTLICAHSGAPLCASSMDPPSSSRTTHPYPSSEPTPTTHTSQSSMHADRCLTRWHCGTLPTPCAHPLRLCYGSLARSHEEASVGRNLELDRMSGVRSIRCRVGGGPARVQPGLGRCMHHVGAIREPQQGAARAHSAPPRDLSKPPPARHPLPLALPSLSSSRLTSHSRSSHESCLSCSCCPTPPAPSPYAS